MSTVWISLEGLDGAEGLQGQVEADARALLEAAKCSDCELSLVLCGDAHIQPLNAQWRGKDAPTDVLSFPQEHDTVLGDLVISVDTAARQAAERGHGLRDELRILLVHGLLHLLGYDHETGEEDHREMAEAEQKLMKRLDWAGEGLISAVS